MFRKIYYDSWKNRVYLWETVNGKQHNKVEYYHPIEYYVPDPAGTYKDIYGNPVKIQLSENRKAVQSLLDGGVSCCEADLPETVKFLQKKYAGVELKTDMSIFNICFLDIEIDSPGEFPSPQTAKYPINLITIKVSRSGEVYTFGTTPYTGNSVPNYCYCETETRMLERFIKFFRKCNFDIITGWSVVQFDLTYILQRLTTLGIEQTISPVDSQYITPKGDVVIGGINLIDYLLLYKRFVKTPLESYSLQTVCMHEINEGKLDFEGTLNTLYKTDWNRFVEYNVQDVLLVDKLDKKVKLLELAVTFAYQALIPIEKTLNSMPVITGYILKYLHKNGMVMNCKTEPDTREYEGGYCYAKAGMYRNVLSFDVESMYPSMIRAFNISPETLVLNPTDTTDLIKTPINGVFYKRQKGIIPQMVEQVFNERRQFKKLHAQAKREGKDKDAEYYDLQQYVRKIFINSVYGILGNKHFHYYNVNNAEAVTLCSQNLIKLFAKSLNEYFRGKGINEDVVVLVDTDSCYVCVDKLNIPYKDNAERIAVLTGLAETELAPLFDRVLRGFAERYGIEQIINFKHEKIITKQMILEKKHYVMEYVWNEGMTVEPKIKYTGVEVIKSSTPAFCKTRLKQVIKLMLDTMDRKQVMSAILEIREAFSKAPIDTIASPRGISKFSEYAAKFLENKNESITIEQAIPEYPKACPMHGKAALAYNYMINKYKLLLQPVNNGTKIKYIYIHPKNIVRNNTIAFIGRWPEVFNSYFKVDYDTQFDKTFVIILNTFFRVLDWGEIEMNQVELDSILDYT